jgi:hypothetical protein
MRTIGIIAITLLASCTSYRIAHETTFASTDGKQLVQNPEFNISIKYFGDYWFHGLNKKEMLNWDAAYMQSLQCTGTEKGKLLYCGHTTMRPYCSTLGIAYMNSTLTNTADVIKTKLSSALYATNLSDTTEFIGSNTVRVIKYDLRDSKLNVTNSHIDYFTEHGGNVIRISFWTREAQDGWLYSESVPILKTFASIPE